MPQRIHPLIVGAAVLAGLAAPLLFFVSPLLAGASLVPLIVGILALAGGQRRTGIVLTALGAVVVVQCSVALVTLQAYQVPSESNAPAIEVGDRVIVQRFGEGDSEIGDIVVFHPPAAATGEAQGVGDEGVCGAEQPDGAACAKPVDGDSSETFIKRVVAVGGDRVAIVGGHVKRNGVLQDEPFVRERCENGIGADFPTEITVPAEHLFMLGDNRQCSEDSRFWGPVREGAVIGKALRRYWPLSRIGKL